MSPAPPSLLDPFAWAGTRVLLTGATGFIGARLASRLVQLGADVHVLQRPAARSISGTTRHAAPLDDETAVRAALVAAVPTYVFHLAAIADWRQDPTRTAEMARVHVIGSAHLLEASRLVGVARFVAFGSAGEYGGIPSPFAESDACKPLDPYSVTKLAATELALTYDRSFGLPCTVLRPFAVYGPGEPPHRLLPAIFGAAAAGGNVSFTEGAQRRDFVYVDDVVECALRAARTAAAAGEILNVGTGRAVTVRQVVELAVEAAGGRVVPRFGALPYRTGEPMVLLADARKAARVLGWTPPTSAADGIRETWLAHAASVA